MDGMGGDRVSRRRARRRRGRTAGVLALVVMAVAGVALAFGGGGDIDDGHLDTAVPPPKNAALSPVEQLPESDPSSPPPGAGLLPGEDGRVDAPLLVKPTCSLTVTHTEITGRYFVVVSVVSIQGGLPVQLQVYGNNYAAPANVDGEGRATFGVSAPWPTTVVALVGSGAEATQCDGELI